MAKAMDLIKAYMQEEIPPEGGFIISAIFSPGTAYAIYEITAYRNVKDVYKINEGIVFKSDGNRTHMLVEPATYPYKSIDPVNREEGSSIPYRLNELDVITAKGNEKIMTAREPMMLYSSFTILEKESDFFAFIFYPTRDVYIAIRKFLTDSLYNDCNIVRKDAAEAAEASLDVIKSFTLWQKGT